MESDIGFSERAAAFYFGQAVKSRSSSTFRASAFSDSYCKTQAETPVHNPTHSDERESCHRVIEDHMVCVRVLGIALLCTVSHARRAIGTPNFDPVAQLWVPRVSADVIDHAGVSPQCIMQTSAPFAKKGFPQTASDSEFPTQNREKGEAPHAPCVLSNVKDTNPAQHSRTGSVHQRFVKRDPEESTEPEGRDAVTNITRRRSSSASRASALSDSYCKRK